MGYRVCLAWLAAVGVGSATAAADVIGDAPLPSAAASVASETSDAAATESAAAHLSAVAEAAG